MATARKFSAEEQRKLLAELEVPFDPAMVKWKVVRRARSGRRGAVLPFADPRAYSDRLKPNLDAGRLGSKRRLIKLLLNAVWFAKRVMVTRTSISAIAHDMTPVFFCPERHTVRLASQTYPASVLGTASAFGHSDGREQDSAQRTAA